MADIGLTHAALEVSDLDASIAFYAEFAGMRVVHRRPGVAWLGDGTRDFVIVLLESERVEAPLLPNGHLGVACASLAEVDRLSEVAREQERLIEGPTDYGPPVGYWAFLRDPDGHTLEISYGQEIGGAVARAGDRSDRN
jgi:catechol 2,3-dioxygenase-like lactoylglutathione lyase family enzyme